MEEDVARRIASVAHWYHRVEVRPGLWTPGINDTSIVLANLGLPEDCHGLRVLDLGTRDGFFAFELARRGADVVAIDYMPVEQTGFAVLGDLLGVPVAYRQENLYNLDRAQYGAFDIVLFLGLLYHLPDPMRALRIVRGLCRGTLYLETQVIDNALQLADGRFAPLTEVAPALADVPLMQFYPGRTLNDDPTNYWAPNLACLRGMLRENNFEVRSETLLGSRAIVTGTIIEDAGNHYLIRIASGDTVPR